MPRTTDGEYAYEITHWATERPQCIKESQKYAECVYENVMILYGDSCTGPECAERCELFCPEASEGNCALCGDGLHVLACVLGAVCFCVLLCCLWSCCRCHHNKKKAQAEGKMVTADEKI